MKERIRLFLEKENISSARFADKIGVQPSAVSHVLSGRNKASLDFILKMLNTYRDLDTEWLLFGRGEMYRKNSVPEHEVQAGPGSLNDETPDRRIRNLFDFDGDNPGIINDDKGIEPVKNDDTSANEQFSELIVVLFPDGTYREYKRGK